jgi:flagellin
MSALKGFQGAASATSANLAAAAARIGDTDFALETANLTKASVLNQAAMAMVAQANQAQAAVLAVIQ